MTNVVFSAGNYIINGGGITFGGGATASGSGVMFYLTGTNATYASVTIANGVNVTFSGPTSGAYTGVLFFQNRSITSGQQCNICRRRHNAINWQPVFSYNRRIIFQWDHHGGL